MTYDRVLGLTAVSWWVPGDEATDVYRGTIQSQGVPGSKGFPQGGKWVLDIDSAHASCFFPSFENVVGNPTAVLPPTKPPTGNNGWTGQMDNLTVDPNPAVGEATFYIVTENKNGGQSNKGLGCANPYGLESGVCTPSSTKRRLLDEKSRTAIPTPVDLCN